MRLLGLLVLVTLSAYSAYAQPTAEEIQLCNSLDASTTAEIPDPALAPEDFWGNSLRIYGYYNNDNSVDFCRVIEYGTTPADPRVRRRSRMGAFESPGRLVCTLGVGNDFGDELRGKTICSPVIDLGSHSTRGASAWTDFDGDNRLDFCTVSSMDASPRIQCRSATGDRFTNVTASAFIGSKRISNVSWVDFNGDKRADFCRREIITHVRRQLVCTLSEGSSFGDTVRYDMPNSLGMLGNWVNIGLHAEWVDINADGKTDFCAAVGKENDIIACHLSTGTSFTDARYEYTNQ